MLEKKTHRLFLHALVSIGGPSGPLPHALRRAELLHARLTVRLLLLCLFFFFWLLQNIQKILLQHFFGFFSEVVVFRGQNNPKGAAKVFFGCFVTTTSLIFQLIFSPLVGTKHPKNTFAALLWMFGWYLYYVRPKQPKTCCKSILWMFCTTRTDFS